MPDAKRKLQRLNKHLRGMRRAAMSLIDPCLLADAASALAHAVPDVEPAVIARQPLGFTSLRQAAYLGSLALHLAFMSRLCGRGRGGLGESRVQRASDEQHGDEANSNAEHSEHSLIYSLN
jgi:hypothetical protein